MSKRDFTRTIEFDKPRKVFFDMNALEELEDALNIDNVFLLLENGNIGAKTLNRLIWAGLLHDNPKLSIKEAARISTVAIQRKGFDYLFFEVMQTLMKGLGVPDEDIEKFATQAKKQAELKKGQLEAGEAEKN